MVVVVVVVELKVGRPALVAVDIAVVRAEDLALAEHARAERLEYGQEAGIQ